MIFSYNWLQQYFQDKLPEVKKLGDLLTMHFAEVEEINSAKNDFGIDIDVRPNRATDCFSHWGIARECGAITGNKFNVPEIKVKEESDLIAQDFVKVNIQEPEACPKYVARVMTDIKVGPSPDWLKQRLETCGLQSINNIVDIANYVMLETGQPLHAFDLDKLNKAELIVRYAKENEKITTLDEQNFDLNPNVLVIADQRGPVAIAGIKGGITPAIDKETKTIVLESANFNRLVVRKGSQILKLKTDASLRFEHGFDSGLAEQAINRVVELILEISGGRVAKGIINSTNLESKPKTIKLDLKYVTSLLGVEVSKQEVLKILENLEFEISLDSGDLIEVKVPSFRLDVSMPEDLIEDIGRIYGYDKIPIITPRASLIPPKINLNIFWEEFTKDSLKEFGFNEVYNYSFINKQKLDLFDLDNAIELENPVSDLYQYLVPSLIPNLLSNSKQNLKYFDQIKLFEIGKIFQNKQAKEKRSLTGLATGKDSFYELKGAIDSLTEQMGINDLWYDEVKPTPEQTKKTVWNINRSAEIKIGDQEIGFLGEASQKVLDFYKIKTNVVLFNIDFEKLQKLASEEKQYVPISPYPSATRDLAILVPKQTKVVEILNAINIQGGKLIRDIDLFDIYQGDEIPDQKKNLAFHLIYQAEDRTLQAEEISKLHEKIINSLEKNPDWEVRK